LCNVVTDEEYVKVADVITWHPLRQHSSCYVEQVYIEAGRPVYSSVRKPSIKGASQAAIHELNTESGEFKYKQLFALAISSLNFPKTYFYRSCWHLPGTQITSGWGRPHITSPHIVIIETC